MIKTKSKTAKSSSKAEERQPRPRTKKKTPRKQPAAREKEQPVSAGGAPTQLPPTAAAASSTTAPEEPIVVDTGTGESAAAAAPSAEVPEGEDAALKGSRMPAVGTVLQKHDRQGALRCQCEIVDGGVRYAGTIYRSLSSAAVAAAKDLGLAAKAMNGFTFWGVSKPPRSSAVPQARLERAWSGYQTRLEAAIEGAKGEHSESLLSTLERHSRVLKNLLDENRLGSSVTGPAG